MSRLNSELDQINKLSLGDGSSKDLQTMLVCAGVVGGLILLSQLGNRVEDGQSPKQLTGPLSSYLVKPTAQDQLSCRAIVCTHAVIQPVVAQVSEQLEISPRYGRGADQLVRVPTSAIMHEGQEAYVWLVVDEFAVPLWVQEVERGEQSTVIAENTGARGLPIRPEHWRSLSAYVRSRIFLAAHNLDNVKLNKLLSPLARVIERPNDKLQAGSKVRSVNAAASS